TLSTIPMTMTDSHRKTRFEISVELIKALTWPLVISIVLIGFWTPLHNIVTQLPNLLSRSESVTIAGLSIKIGKDIGRQVSPKVKEVISELSPEGLHRLINAPPFPLPTVSAVADKPGETEYAELIKLGLMENIPTTELQTLG